MSATNAIPEAPVKEFVITRELDAPREAVWKAWTNAESMKQWWGPKGCTILQCKMDLRPGGVFHYCMRYLNNEAMWGKFVYREITAPERIAWVSSFSDENGGVTRHPFSETWPLELLSIMTLSENEGKTTLTLRWAPIAPSDIERETFNGGHDSMRQGWTGTLDQLTEFLARAEGNS
jgi:uncharacterized protein YndB with AHSA1/START domain